MNLFVAVLSKAPDLSLDTADVARFLPAAPASTATWRAQSGRLQIASFLVGPGGTGRDLIESEGDWAVVVDGILLPTRERSPRQHGDWLLRELRAARGHEGFDCDGEYAVVWSDGESLYARTNVGCSHNLYIAEAPGLVAVSNRSVCLLGLEGVGDEQDPDAVRWQAFQGYVGASRTSFSAIRKLQNGTRLTVRPSGAVERDSPSVASLVDRTRRESFRRDPRRAFDEAIDDIAQYMVRVHRQLGGGPIDLPLSGGKDSRVIFALLLHAGLRPEIASVWTRGTLYSPEVLAAQDLCRSAGYRGHEVRRPPYFSQAPSGINARTVIRTIDLGEGMLSVFDFCAIAPRDTIRFQGHELGLRAGRFAHCRTGDLEEFIADALGSWPNPLDVGRGIPELRDQIRRFFVEEHERGTRVEDLGDAFSVFQRLPNWAGVINATDYCSGPTSNPLLEGGVVEFAFDVPAHLRRGELFHYAALSRAAPQFLAVPFAEQKWPRAVEEGLRELGLGTASVTPPPFKSRPYFPDLRDPYIPNIKLGYYRKLQPVIFELMDKHRDFFEDLLDVDRVVERAQAVTDPTMQHLYVSLGVYSAVILREYGTDIFDRTRQADVVGDLQARIETSHASHEGGARPADAVWLDLLERHELALAGFMREIHGVSGIATVLHPAEEETETS